METNTILAIHTLANILITIIACFFWYQGYQSWKRNKEAEEELQEFRDKQAMALKLKDALQDITSRFVKDSFIKVDKSVKDNVMITEEDRREWQHAMLHTDELLTFYEWMERKNAVPKANE